MPRAPGHDRPGKRSPNAGKLAKLTEAQRRTFLVYLIEQVPVSRAWALTEELYPNIEPYRIESVWNYARSSQAEEEKEHLLKELRQEAPKRGFAHRNSRIAALNKSAGRLLGLLWQQKDGEIANIVKLSQEWRQTLVAIREEVDPLGMQDTKTLSHVEEYLRFREQVKERVELPGVTM